VLLVARSQHADGSFAHVCDASRDVHYTAWMSMELDRIGELIADPNVDRILARTWAFLKGRVSGDGAVGYQESLPTGAVIYYYSQPVCPSDYDTRGWVNELAYHALLFDRYQDGRYHGVMARLSALGVQGAFPDKWDYWPPPGDPTYLWSSSPRSVMRTSVAFWALAAVQARRAARGQVAYLASEGAASGPAAEGAPAFAESRRSTSSLAGREPPLGASLAPPHPNPTRGEAWIELQAGGAGDLRLAILDAAGRRVRTLLSGPHGPGARRVRWDGRDDRGARVAPGIYFVRLEAEGRVHGARLVLVD
jgi:hypothetical protein